MHIRHLNSKTHAYRNSYLDFKALKKYYSDSKAQKKLTIWILKHRKMQIYAFKL